VTRTRTPALLAIALFVPALAVGVAADGHQDDETTTVTVAPIRVGDGYRIEEALDLPENESRSTRVVTVGEPGTVRDRYGIERETVPFLVQRRVDGDVVGADRCHGARGHVDAVQRVPLVGDGLETNVEAATDGDDALWTDENPRRTQVLASFDPGPCYRRNPLAGETLAEGDRIRLAAVWPQMAQDARPADPGPVRSAPAEPTTFHGRDALEFRFRDVELATQPGRNASAVGLGGTYTFVVADGLPGVVRSERDVRLDLDLDFGIDVGCWGCPPDPGPDASTSPADGSSEDQEGYGSWDWSFDFDLSYHAESELAGYERGDGPALEAPAQEPLVPPTTPHGGSHDVGLRPADASAFEVPYPHGPAWDDIRNDPGTVAFLERHPDAYAHEYTYDWGKRPEEPEDARTDGGWTFVFADDEGEYEVTTTQVTGADTPAGTVESPEEAPVKDRDRRDGEWPAARDTLPDEVPGAEALAAPVAAHGIGPDEVEHVTVRVDPRDEGPSIKAAVANVSYADPPEDARGVEMRLDVREGGLEVVKSTEPVQREEGPRASYRPTPLADEADTAAFGLPAGPESGAGLAAAGAAGVGLLALLAKFVLLPLYARIRRDELLDDPVRQALHDRAREDPGVHQAALVEEAGVGKGAALHHIRKLVEADLLARFEQGGYVRYHVPGEADPEEARREAVLRAGSNRPVYEALAEDPTRSLRDVAGEVGVSAPTVHRSVEQLREAGLVDEEGRPRTAGTPAQAQA
jgi:DNA-binding transcriptional ArsR family regulator